MGQDVGVFPDLITWAGLEWSVGKTPTFQTRIQRAVSGRELRALDYPYPLWQFELNFNFLRDPNDSRLILPQSIPAATSELRTLMGFVMLCQGAYGTFLFNDPTDNFVPFQKLLPAISVASAAIPAKGGSGYAMGDVVFPPGGVTTNPASFSVAGVSGSGAVTSLTVKNPGNYSVVPPITLNFSGGSGTGLVGSVTWVTTVQLARTLSAISPSTTTTNPIVGQPGLLEPITAPNTLYTIFYNGVPQLPTWSLDSSTGIVTLALPFFTAQPTIEAEFTFYFRCRFISDSYAFENFMKGLWQLKKLNFISVIQ